MAEFLQLPSYMESAVRPPFKPLDTSRPEQLLDVAERVTGRRSMPLNPQKIAPFALLWDEWCQHAGGEARRREGEAARRAQYYLSLGAQPLDEWTIYRLTGEGLRTFAEGDR